MKKTILSVDCQGYKPLPTGESLRIVGQNFNFESVTDTSSSFSAIENLKQIDVLISNTPSLELFEKIRDAAPRCTIILVTDLPMTEYSSRLGGLEESLVDHVIANKVYGDWTITELRITLAKLLDNDVFGIEKYLAPNTPIIEEVIKSSKEREYLNSKIFEFAKSCHLGQHTSRMAFGICEELLTNTIYDAPTAAGVKRFKNIDQTVPVELKPEEQGMLRVACDGKILAISTFDPFGALKKEKLFKYLKKVLMRNSSDGLIDNKVGGAGLGFFKILYSSHSIICNVSPGKKTEIMALIHVNESLRDFSVMARSIHFFQGNDTMQHSA